jgi:hypothetical protein
VKKGLASLAVAVMLFAACGKEKETSLLAPSPSAEATATAKAKAGATAKPGDTTPAAGGAPKTVAPASGAGPAPAAKAPAGRSNKPKDGTYLYALTGKASNQFDPSGPPQNIDGEQTNKISHSGNVYTNEQTRSDSPGRTTVRSNWLDTKVEMLSFKAETQIGDFSCTFKPPLLIAKFPTKPEKFPTQQLKGDGNACNGTLDITVVKKDSSKDATGKTWETWQVKVKLTFKSGQLSSTSDETRWVSPDLGAEIRSVAHTDFQYGPQKGSADTTSVLKKHP